MIRFFRAGPPTEARPFPLCCLYGDKSARIVYNSAISHRFKRKGANKVPMEDGNTGDGDIHIACTSAISRISVPTGAQVCFFAP